MLPELAHWFGVHGADLDDMPLPELAVYTKRLRGLPPIGGTSGVWTTKGD